MQPLLVLPFAPASHPFDAIRSLFTGGPGRGCANECNLCHKFYPHGHPLGSVLRNNSKQTFTLQHFIDWNMFYPLSIWTVTLGISIRPGHTL